jgi:hypothetical protein
MRACQFCGAVLESAEPAAEESAPAETPVPEAAPQTAFEESAPPPASPESAPVASAAPSAPVLSLADGDGDRAESQPTKNVKAPVPNKRAMSCAVSALIGVVVVWLLLFFGYRLISNFTGAGNSPSDNSAQRPNSRSSSRAVTAANLGVDVYPGSRPESDPERRDSAESTIVSQTFVSSAKVDLVIDFYKARMVGQASIYASGSGVVVSINPSALESIQIGIASEPGGGTRFAITHTTQKGSQ